MSETILSILIPSLEIRKNNLSDLVCDLFVQCGYLKGISVETVELCTVIKIKFNRVEIIIAIDNKSITTGTKRNLLLNLSSGYYIITIDDDDSIPSYYVEELLKASESDADCFAINGIITTNGKDEIEWRLSKDNPNVTKIENGKTVYLRTCNHITAVKRELALKAMFPDICRGEDSEYSKRLNSYLKTEYKIERQPMYMYKFITNTKEY